jgi:FkbH-like protein
MYPDPRLCRHMSSTAAPNSSPPQILIGATFTATPLAEPLQFWIAELGLPHDVGFAPYQQLFQTLISPASLFSANERGANVALFRLEDLAPEGAHAEIERHAGELIAALRSAAQASRVPFITCLCPPSPRFRETEEGQRFSERLETEVARELTGQPNLYVVSADNAISRYQVTAIEDALAERTGHVPYHSSFLTALATEILRVVLAATRKPLKVIAFDCDNTLWTGVCGEDGPQNVVIDSGRRSLQQFLLKQKENGVLLAIVSKNNEADVRETFSAHPGIVLRWNDITAHRINWESKSRNLLELVNELNLGLDSFVFVDDDAKECGEVRSELPEVATLEIPHPSSAIRGFLEHAWIFDRVAQATAEDQLRSQLYAEQLERSRFEKQARDLREFLAGLRLNILFAPVTPESLARAAQLIQRTNQMNTSLVRFGEGELKSDLESGRLEAFSVTVSDRFGSYGLVGLLLFRTEPESLRVENFLLSCRALGRGVEHKMLQHAAAIANERGKQRIEIRIAEGARNQPARDFLRTIPGSVFTTAHGTFRVVETLEASELELPQLASDGQRPSAVRVKGESPEKTGHQNIDFQRIAESLYSAESIGAAILQRRREQAQPGRRAGTPPQNELQSKLAAIWCDLLGLRAIGIDEDFFDLGGHSLLAVQLLSRIHEELGVDLPDAVIYGEKLRIDNLARTIELERLGISDQATYDSMLAEIESLSDEEVAALLANEESRQ